MNFHFPALLCVYVLLDATPGLDGKICMDYIAFWILVF